MCCIELLKGVNILFTNGLETIKMISMCRINEHNLHCIALEHENQNGSIYKIQIFNILDIE